MRMGANECQKVVHDGHVSLVGSLLKSLSLFLLHLMCFLPTSSSAATHAAPHAPLPPSKHE